MLHRSLVKTNLLHETYPYDIQIALGSRAALRAYLTRNGLSWAEDPSNQDDAFGRIRARRALELLEDTGLTAEALVRVADNMARARDALDQCTTDAAQEVAKIRHGAPCTAGVPSM